MIFKNCLTLLYLHKSCIMVTPYAFYVLFVPVASFFCLWVGEGRGFQVATDVATVLVGLVVHEP
jgi:Na+/H+ antiporter NhaC